MPHESPTERERRNLELVEAWADAWKIPDGSPERLVHEIYADSVEIAGPLQGAVPIRHGQPKDPILAVEEAHARGIAERRMVFHKKVAQGDVVALEVEVPYVTKDGTKGTEWFAAFLTFDDDGRITEDHTFLRDRPFRPRKGPGGAS